MMKKMVTCLTLTIIKCIHQLTRIDLCSSNQYIIQCPLSTIKARNHNSIVNYKWLPPTQASCIGQSIFWEQDVIMSDGDVFLIIHLMEQCPRYSYRTKIQGKVRTNQYLRPHVEIEFKWSTIIQWVALNQS